MVNNFSSPWYKEFPRQDKHDTHQTKPFQDSFQQTKGKSMLFTKAITISRNSMHPAICNLTFRQPTIKICVHLHAKQK